MIVLRFLFKHGAFLDIATNDRFGKSVVDMFSDQVSISDQTTLSGTDDLGHHWSVRMKDVSAVHTLRVQQQQPTVNQPQITRNLSGLPY